MAGQVYRVHLSAETKDAAGTAWAANHRERFGRSEQYALVQVHRMEATVW